MTRDCVEDFAELIARTTYEDLPQEAVAGAVNGLLDTLAVSYAAVDTSPSLAAAVRLALTQGPGPASLIGRPEKVSALMAAFANGALVHFLDYDDVEFDSVYHPSGALVPALLALCEAQGGVSGRELITAIAIGQDLGIRMARAIPTARRPPWHRSVLIGTFAAAAACAKVMGLSAEGIRDALGHALNQAAGSLEMRWSTASEIGCMYVAYSAHSGLFSAMMAQAGVPSVSTVFDGQAGFFNLYFDGYCAREKLLGGLGQVFTGAECSLKPWPCCAAINTYVLALLNGMKTHAFSAHDILEIELLAGNYAIRNCEPLEDRRRPLTAPDAKFSLPYCVAIAAQRGWLGLKDFDQAARRDPEVLAITAKITARYDASYDIQHTIPAGAMHVKLTDGRVLFLREETPLGHLLNPLTAEDLCDKLRDCFLAVDASPERSNQLLTMVTEHQHLTDVRTITKLLSKTG